MTAISANYRELIPAEVPAIAAELAKAWQDPNIPRRQFELAVKSELEKLTRGYLCEPFKALHSCLPEESDLGHVLDVGASSGYYKSVLAFSGRRFQYTGCDFSPAFKQLAEELYPGIDFHVCDATSLPFHDDSFDLVLSGACIMHCADYISAVKEAVRVSRRYVIFHRTPILRGKNTTFFLKDAYGVSCLEVHFSEPELMNLFRDCGLTLRTSRPVFWNESESFGHQTYLLEKLPGLMHIQV